MSDDVTMARICEVLAETYSERSVAVLLQIGVIHDQGGSLPVVDACLTPEGRRRVLDWAESLAGQVAT